MGRLLGIDYGRKRTGIAATDPLQIIASPLETVPTYKIWDFLKAYFEKETVDKVVVGYPKQMDNTDSEAAKYVNEFMNRFKKLYPNMPLITEDERFTSVMAHRAMIEGGMKKKDRQVKGNVDKISASLILQTFMEPNL